MTGKPFDLGALGKAVAENVTRLRESLRWTYADTAAALVAHGRPINAVAVRRIEAGERRIDVDDLEALAAVFGLSIPALLEESAAEHYRSKCLRWLMAEDNYKHGRSDKPVLLPPFTINRYGSGTAS